MGIIYNIQRFSLHDGPGIRTTVFLKGCPLRCKWCHNPESQTIKPQLSLFSQRCIGCGKCFQTCAVHQLNNNVHQIDYTSCKACGQCVSACPSAALEIIGKEATADEIVSEALRDTPFYQTSGGGITLSGGEPTMQAEFALEILKLSKTNGLHTAIETCGYGDDSVFKLLLPSLNLVLFDIKQMNPEKHKRCTGVDNRLILDNLKRLCKADQTVEVIVRTPVIPRFNDDIENYVMLSAFLQTFERKPRVELLPYNSLAGSKYPRLGIKFELGDTTESSGTSPDVLKDILVRNGINAKVLR